MLILVALLAVSSTAYSSGGASRFKAELGGTEEVPPVVTAINGEIKVKFNDALSEASFDLRVFDGVAVTQAHFHCAPVGVNGPIVAVLFGSATGGIPGGFDVDGDLAEFTVTDANITPISAACPSPITTTIDSISTLAQEMRNSNIYANVHTVANPTGGIRGQLIATSNVSK